MAKDLAGTMLGKYQVMERLGRGGMADVYRAYQPGLDRYVAIKVMHGHLTEDPSFVTRFKREAQSVASLRHPNIVQVIDFDVQDDEFYMVMEFIQGETLKALLQRRGALPVSQALDISIRLADALAYAHSQSMIHRDIKPANILFTKDSTPILADFGIARLTDMSGLTAGSAVIGTPAYISPEAGRGEKVDERADIYGLGIVLYEMLTGKVPYDADTPYAVILKHINDPLPMPRQFVESLPESVERLVLKSLAKNKEDRFQTAAEFKKALENARDNVATEMPTKAGVTHPMSAQDTQAGTIVERGPSRGGLGVPIAIAAVVIIVIALGGMVFLRPVPTATPPPASNTVVAVVPTVAPPTSAPTAAATATMATTATTVATATTAVTATTASKATTAATAAAANATTAGGQPQANSGKYSQLIADVVADLEASSPDRHLDQVEAALKADPQSYDLLVLRARIRAGVNDLRNKVPEDVEAAVKIDPNRPEAYVAMGLYYQWKEKPDGNNQAAIDDYKKAIFYYTKAIDLGSTDYSAYWFRGWANDTLNGYVGRDNNVQNAEIIKDFDKAASFAPKIPQFYQYVGDFYYYQNMYPEALPNYEQAAKLQPDDTNLHAHLGPTYLMLDQKQKAYDLYKNGIEKLRNRDPKYIADGAYVAWVNNDLTKATEWAELALLLEPKTVAAIYVQALLAINTKDYEQALKKLDQVLQFDPNEYRYPYLYLNRFHGQDVYADRARVLTALGRIDEAIAAYDESMKTSDGWIPLWTEKALLLKQQGKIEEARAALRRALELADRYNDTKASAEILDMIKKLGTEAATAVATAAS